MAVNDTSRSLFNSSVLDQELFPYEIAKQPSKYLIDKVWNIAFSHKEIPSYSFLATPAFSNPKLSSYFKIAHTILNFLVAKATTSLPYGIPESIFDFNHSHNRHSGKRSLGLGRNQLEKEKENQLKETAPTNPIFHPTIIQPSAQLLGTHQRQTH